MASFSGRKTNFYFSNTTTFKRPSFDTQIAAELNDDERKRYQAIKRLPTFYAKYRDYIEFIYLHELAHILFDFDKIYTTITAKYERGKVSKEYRDSVK